MNYSLYEYFIPTNIEQIIDTLLPQNCKVINSSYELATGEIINNNFKICYFDLGNLIVSPIFYIIMFYLVFQIKLIYK